MKLKFKLNGAAIKALAIQHGEKAGFFLGVCVLILFIWSAAKMDILGDDKNPDKLGAAAQAADEHIKNSQWDPKAKGIEVIDYVHRAKRDPLNDKDYRIAHVLNGPVWESKGKRPDPKLLPVEEMMASAGLGIFALSKDVPPEEVEKPHKKKLAPPKPPKPGPGGKGGKDAPPKVAAPPRRQHNHDVEVQKGMRANGSSDLKGFSWVVITGLVPGRKQEVEFEESFRNVIKPIPEADEPEYRGLKIERAEIVAGGAPVWQEIKLKDIEAFKRQWQAEAHEVVEDSYIDPMYTMPLGPLVGADWDPAVVSHPKVQLAEKPGSLHKQSAAAEPSEEEEEDEIAWNGRPVRTEQFGAPPAANLRKKGKRADAPVRRTADITLFRFIDCSVSPGKQYQYRVKLKLTNPNYGVTERYLKDPASKNQKYVYTPWSQPTPVVTIPRDIEVFAGTVVKPSVKDPLMKLMITMLDRALGQILVAEKTVQRGDLANLRKTIETEPLNNNGPPVEVDALLKSDIVIVDIQGGKPLKGLKSVTVPGEIVILEPDGSLVVRDELDDEEAYHTNLPPEDTQSTGAADLLGNDPYGSMHKSDAPKKSKLATLKAEAKAKKGSKKKKKRSG